MSGYCETAQRHELDRAHHDMAHGVPVREEARLFERFCMEIFQAGLSWRLILSRQGGMYEAFDGYDVDIVANYSDADRARLLRDERIIRNRLKVDAVIHNARVVQKIRETHGGFAYWLDAHHPRTKPDWVKLFKATFKFTGGEITGEFLMSTGYLPGAHHSDCPAFHKIADLSPPWMTVPNGWVW